MITIRISLLQLLKNFLFIYKYYYQKKFYGLFLVLIFILTINDGNRNYKEVKRLLGISKNTLIRENNKCKVEN